MKIRRDDPRVRHVTSGEPVSRADLARHVAPCPRWGRHDEDGFARSLLEA